MSIPILALVGLIGGYCASSHACYDDEIFDECLWMCMTSQSGRAQPA